MPVTTARLDKLFRDFRKAGYFAKQDFWCCQSCAWSAVPDKVTKTVFYHNQDAEAIVDGELVRSLYLAWKGNGEEICNIIRANGMRAEWNGSEDKRIEIVPEIEPLELTFELT
jgi:hypothetical protein